MSKRFMEAPPDPRQYWIHQFVIAGLDPAIHLPLLKDDGCAGQARA
jgi:hypothetical protein